MRITSVSVLTERVVARRKNNDACRGKVVFVCRLVLAVLTEASIPFPNNVRQTVLSHWSGRTPLAEWCHLL